MSRAFKGDKLGESASNSELLTGNEAKPPTSKGNMSRNGRKNVDSKNSIGNSRIKHQKYGSKRDSHSSRNIFSRSNHSDEHDNNAEEFADQLQHEIMNGNYKLRGRKTKISIDKFLDFQLPDIDRDKENGTNYRARNQRKRTADDVMHLHGDEFINVNYRLILKNGEDYKEQDNDPNVVVPSEKIVRVLVPQGQSCPICLTDEPIAPRMVTCGHIFCYTCLLNFFSVKEFIKNATTGYEKPKKYKDCPLCGSIVRPHNVKPVILEAPLPKESQKMPGVLQPGATMSIPLMLRPHNSLLALPVHMGIDSLEVGTCPSVDHDSLAPYSKKMISTTANTLEMYQKEIDAINDQYEVDHAIYGVQDKFAKQAVEEINNKISSILEEMEQSESLVKNDNDPKLQPIDLRLKYNDSNSFFFYQVENMSSTKFFLSPLDVKVLRDQYQTYGNFPDTIDVKIENIHYGFSVNESLIKRFKYIGHLPLGTEFALVDIDWKDSAHLSKPVYDKHSVELKQRKRKFDIKKKREDTQKELNQKRLEKEHQDFYKRENGLFYGQENTVNHSNISIQDLDAINDLSLQTDNENNDTSESQQKKKSSYSETTIWGTSIKVQMDDKTVKENEQFEAELLQKMQNGTIDDSDIDTNNSDTSRKSRKNKKSRSKVLLFSTGGQGN